MKSKKVHILGAGIGGLSAAIALAAQGFDVTIYEKNDRVGGKMNTYAESGFRFDLGPHVLTLPFIIKDLYDLTNVTNGNNSLYDKFSKEFLKLNIINRYFFKDKILDITDDHSKNINTIRQFFPEDYDSYTKISKLSKKYFDSTKSQFTQYKKSNIKDYFKLILLPFYMPFSNVEKFITKNIKNENLKDLYRLFGFYIGADSKHTLKLYLMLQHIQEVYGVYYIKGGLYNLAISLKSLAVQKKVHIIINSNIKEMVTTVNKIISLQFDDKQINVENDIVVSNIDYAFTHSIVKSKDFLIKKKIVSNIKKYYEIPLSSSAFIILLGINIKLDMLSHHNTIFAGDIIKEYKYIFDKKELYMDPVIGIDMVTKDDPSAAPYGCENLFIMTNPPSQSNINWENIKENYANSIIKLIENRLKINLSDHIMVKKIITPHDIETMYHQPGGAIYGQSVWGIKGLKSRNKNKSDIFDNLYFCGGSIRPGGGIPMVISSGMTTAKEIKRVYS